MQSEGSATAPVTPQVVMDNLMAFQRTFALKAAIELDVFGAVGQGLGDVGSIARHCQASERGIRILCDYLVISGLLQKDNGQYRHTPASAAFLDPASSTCIASMHKFLSAPDLHEPYKHLAEIVRAGKTVLPGHGAVEPENPMWVEFAESMAPMRWSTTAESR